MSVPSYSSLSPPNMNAIPTAGSKLALPSENQNIGPPLTPIIGSQKPGSMVPTAGASAGIS